MGLVEELEEDQDICSLPTCQKAAELKCKNSAGKIYYYCCKACQKKHWKDIKFEFKSLPYKIEQSPEVGRFLEATRDIQKGEVLWTEAPLVVSPVAITPPVCLDCYAPVNGSYLCRKSGWPVCAPKCEKKIEHNPEVVIPHQTEGRFEIESYQDHCYIYECVGPLRVLLMQKTSPKKYKKIMTLESHNKLRKGTEAYAKAQENVIDVMKKTLGVMVFEVLYPQFDFSDETIQEIVGIFETNSIEIRLQQSEVNGLYEIGSMMEHSCCPNVRMSFDDKFNMTITAGRDISKGEHFSIMYSHSLWGTQARRAHLLETKKFLCFCPRCKDATEFGTDFSSIIREGKLLRQTDPTDTEAPWVSADGETSVPSFQVAAEMQHIGQTLAVLQMDGTIENYEDFLATNGKVLHPNHYHMLTAKHSLLQMLGRTEGCLIQDMPIDMLQRKEHLCREVIALCEKLDPAMVRLQIYTGSSLFELHLPLLQYGKRKWEIGELPTEDFRKTLYEPRDILKRAQDILKEETNEKLPEGQLRIQINETLSQLEEFMKTLGCEDM